MPRTDFDRLPDDARLWVFPLGEPLEGREQDVLEEAIQEFLDSWAAHGTPLTGGYRMEAGRFVLVAVDQASVPPSGCSIDSMIRVLKALEARFGKPMVSHGDVFFRDEAGEIKAMSRKDFRAAAKVGRVTPDTPVFDTTLTAMDAFRRGALERPARESWHGSVFFA